MNPFFSVVIPTYNHAHFIGRAIQSVLNQSYTNWEILVIDNNSIDNTEYVINSFNDNRIKLLKINNYGIIAASRNKGILNSKGDWVAFLDSDDLWYPQKLQKIVENIEINQDYHVFSVDEYMVYENSKKKKELKYGPYKKDNYYKFLILNGNKLSPSATVVRKDILLKKNILFNENKEFITVEDYDFWLQIAYNGFKFKFIKSYQGEYLIHESNNSKSSIIHETNFLKLLKYHIYQIQRFDLNKDNLWEKIYVSYLVSKVKKILYEKKIKLGVLYFAYIFSKKPYLTIKYFISKILKFEH